MREELGGRPQQAGGPVTVQDGDVMGRVQSMLRAWEARDIDGFLAHLTPDVYWHDPGMPAPPAVGRPAVRGFVESVFRAFPDFRYEVRAPICIAADGSSCAVPWTISGTNTGPLEPPGFAPSGRAVRFDGVDYLQFRDGLVSRIETRFDPAEPIAQLLGVPVRPRPGSAAERALVRLQRAWAGWVRRRGGPDKRIADAERSASPT